MAVKLFTIGSFFGLIFAIILFPILYLITKFSYGVIEPFFAIILIVVSLFMLYRDEKKMWAILVFAGAGIFGMIVFNLNMKDPLLPMLSGLFGISTLIISLSDSNAIPKQNNETYIKLENKKTLLSMIWGNFSAFIVSTFPGLSGSIAAVISMQFVKDLGDKGFMILMGCIGTSGFVLSLVALYAVDKARNGAVIVIAKLIPINATILLIFICVSLIAGSAAVVLSLFFGRVFSKIVSVVNYKLLAIIIIVFVTFLVFLLTSWLGLLILATSVAIGLIPGIVKVQRTQAMACLILPTILYLL